MQTLGEFHHGDGGDRDGERSSVRADETGLKPATEGWFVVNVRDAARWMQHETFGAGCPFGAPEVGFREFGIKLRVLEPGQANGL